MTLYVGYPNLPNPDTFYSKVDEVLTTRRLTNNGPYVKEFEKRCAEFLEVDHAIAVCNATIGLQIVAKALDLQGSVIVPSWTFVATASAMEWIGLRPVFCDVYPSHLIDASEASRLISDDTAAIIGVHTWGRPCDCTFLEVAGRVKGVPVFYDAAHAFGCTKGGKKIGNFGVAEVFSFHATKCVHSFEGGLITTNDGDLAERCRRMRNFGFVNYDDVQDFGINGKMSEIHAAMGLSMLDRYEKIVAVNKRNFDLYQELLPEHTRLVTPFVTDTSNYHYVVVDFQRLRNAVMEHLHDHDIMARRYFYPGIHRMPPYAGGRPLSVTESLSRRTLVLPNGTGVTEADVERICSLIKEALCQ